MAKEAKVKLTADNRKLKRGLKDSNKSVNVFEKGVGAAGKALMKFAGPLAIGAALKGLVSMAKELATNADRLLDLEQITNISTDTLQEYEHVARVAGVNSEFFSNAVIGLTQRLSRGAEMSASLKQGLDALNISVKNQDGSMRNFGQVAEEAIEQLAEMDNVSQRNTIGAQLFSGAWKDLAPVLALGADGIEQAKEEARELGLVMDKASLEQANNFRVELETLTAEFKMFKQEVGLAVIPVISDLIAWLNRARTAHNSLIEQMGKRPPRIELDIDQVVKDTKKTVDTIIDEFKKGGEKSSQELIQEYQRVINEESNKLRMPIPDEDAFGWGKKAKQEFAQAKAEAERYNMIIDETISYSERQIEMLTEVIKREKELLKLKKEEIQAEKERRIALGEIGRLQEDIATAEAEFISANSQAERDALYEQISLLKEKLALIQQASQANQNQKDAEEKVAELDKEDKPKEIQSIQTPESMTIPTIDADQYVESVDKIGEAVDNNKDKFTEWQAAAEQSAYQVGAALGQLATDSDKSTGEIIKNLLSQVMAQMISQIVASVPFPANLAIAAGAGALSTTLFNQVPGYADGTDYHPGGMAWVGEKGPELVNLPRGSSVMTNRESMMQGMTDVKFIIQGDKLVGVLNRYTNRLRTNA